MALPVIHSYSRNISRDAILAGKYANIRIHGLEGNMNPFQPWATLRQAVRHVPTQLLPTLPTIVAALACVCTRVSMIGRILVRPNMRTPGRSC